MGPYTCIGENCGKRTLNDSHLCDEHDVDPPDDDEPEEPTDPEATPIVTGDDPDEVLPDLTDPPGGES